MYLDCFISIYYRSLLYCIVFILFSKEKVTFMLVYKTLLKMSINEVYVNFLNPIIISYLKYTERWLYYSSYRIVLIEDIMCSFYFINLLNIKFVR